ncbi:MAG: hypothetical protein ACOY9B_11630 [Pseudomonadota bacterium]
MKQARARRQRAAAHDGIDVLALQRVDAGGQAQLAGGELPAPAAHAVQIDHVRAVHRGRVRRPLSAQRRRA